MRLLDEAKQFFWLRRIAIALEKQNSLTERHIQMLEQDYNAKHMRPMPTKTEFSLMDQDEINKDYLRRLEAQRDGIELDD